MPDRISIVSASQHKSKHGLVSTKNNVHNLCFYISNDSFLHNIFHCAINNKDININNEKTTNLNNAVSIVSVR